VFYGANQSRALVDLVCNDGMPQNIPIVLSRNEIAKEEYLAQQHSPGGTNRLYQIDTNRHPFLNKF